MSVLAVPRSMAMSFEMATEEGRDHAVP